MLFFQHNMISVNSYINTHPIILIFLIGFYFYILSFNLSLHFMCFCKFYSKFFIHIYLNFIIVIFVLQFVLVSYQGGIQCRGLRGTVFKSRSRKVISRSRYIYSLSALNNFLPNPNVPAKLRSRFQISHLNSLY